MARALHDTGRYVIAEETYRAALAIYDMHDPSMIKGLCLASYGELLTEVGRAADGESYVDQAIALYHKKHGNDHWFVGVTLRVRGQVLHALGRLTEAEQALIEARDLLSKLLGNDHVEVGKTLT